MMTFKEVLVCVLVTLPASYYGETTEDYSDLCLNPVDFSPAGLMSIQQKPKVIHYSCKPGFTLKGPPKQECVTNGTWNPPKAPTCISNSEEDQKCPKPFVVNGNIGFIYRSQFKVGESVTIECEDTYAIQIERSYVRSILIQCGQDGRWYYNNRIHLDPQCSVKVCKNPPEVPNSRINLNSLSLVFNKEDMFVEGQFVYYQCIDGFSLVDKHARQLTCTDGEWDGILPSCVVMNNCNQPQKIDNGDYYLPSMGSTYSLNYKLGSEVTYRCNDGYKLRGPGTLVCLEGPRWSHYPPKCIPVLDSSIYCPSISNIADGSCFCGGKNDLQYCEPFFWGLHVECVCNEGFKLIGQSIVTCKKDGTWDYRMPTCVQEVEINSQSDTTSGPPVSHMSTLAIVVATACSVLGVLLLMMVIMVFRRRKPHPPRLCRPTSTPPPYSRVHSNPQDEHDRVLLIGYENNPTGQVPLPSYEEAIRSQPHSTHFGSRSGSSQVGEYRPLPSIPSNLRGNSSQSGDNSNRHSVITTSTINRDGVSEIFGSIDTVNVSVSDASTAVTIETFDSASSHHSSVSRRATAGSINSSNDSLATEDVPLIDSNQRHEEIMDSRSIEEDKEED